MYMFKFSVDNTKECIIETEQNLRDLISTVLTAKYGSEWDSTSYGFSESERAELEHRRHDEQKKFTHQPFSDRLLDYSDILHLKSLIEKNWQHFSRVFLSKDNTMAIFDMLQKLRNPVMHGRPGLLLHQYHLCLGICGELLLAVENWRQGYTHAVKSYTCDLRFSVYPEGVDEEAAQAQAKDLAHRWLETVSNKLAVKPEVKSSDDLRKEWLLRLSGGHLKISMAWNYRGYDGHHFRSADIKLRTSSPTVIDQVLTEGRYPYRTLFWVLSDDFDVSIIASHIREMTGQIPSSSGGVQIGLGRPVLTSADFRIGAFDDANIRVALSRGEPNIGATVGLVYDGKPNKGFFHAHKVFSVDIILSILYGKLAPEKVYQHVKDSCILPS